MNLPVPNGQSVRHSRADPAAFRINARGAAKIRTHLIIMSDRFLTNNTTRAIQ
jgi:hypothetical protein